MHVLGIANFEEWRVEARKLLALSIPPRAVRFRGPDVAINGSEGMVQRELFESRDLSPDQGRVSGTRGEHFGKPVAVRRVSNRFLELARAVACHRAPDRFDRLYRIVWRLTHGEPEVLNVVTDDDVHWLVQHEQAVRRDAHKMKAFVRFRAVIDHGEESFIAWHRPDHRIVRLVAPFFARRFPAMKWMILTPDESVVWNKHELTFGPGAPDRNTSDDDWEELWRTYYKSIFNPARIKIEAMKREMPVRHWPTLPETKLIPELLADAPRRVAEMVARNEGFDRSAADFLPPTLHDPAQQYDALRNAAAICQGCDLHGPATQTVFGEGPVASRIVLVGEQPGDREDLSGRPFVGPAGDVLDQAFHAAGLTRAEVYLTNAVKHFRFELRGKRRMHKKADSRQVIACHPWLHAEVAMIQPSVLVCLGVTAAQAILGRDFRITQQRGKILRTRFCNRTVATYHPSAVLRAPDQRRREEVFQALVADLRLAISQ